jgi:hypothetical protein
MKRILAYVESAERNHNWREFKYVPHGDKEQPSIFDDDSSVAKTKREKR